jgi:thioredoxin reductase (NADPH)
VTEERIENVIIIGGGPAGYTAALYTSRADLEPLAIEGFLWGGLLQQTTDVENYPGFPDGIMGPEMMQKFRDQAERFGTRFISEDATRVELSRDGSEPHRVWVGDDEYKARSIILSMGANHRKLGVPGEEELASRGISYCATCDAAFFREKKIAVVGGGDSAFEEAIFLSKFGSTVELIHRRDEFRASQIMQQRAREIENIEFVTPYAPVEFHSDGGGNGTGTGIGSLEKIELKNSEDGSTRELVVDGTFIAIGHIPNSQLVEGQVETDENGYVVTEGKSTRVGIPGVFAAGDLVDHTYRQAVTAAGSGCQAALDAEWYLRDAPPEANWLRPDEIERDAERVKAGDAPMPPGRLPV